PAFAYRSRRFGRGVTTVEPAAAVVGHARVGCPIGDRRPSNGRRTRRGPPRRPRLGDQEVEGERPEGERSEGHAGSEQVGGRHALGESPCQVLRIRSQKKDGWGPPGAGPCPSAACAAYVGAGRGPRTTGCDGHRHGAHAPLTRPTTLPSIRTS